MPSSAAGSAYRERLGSFSCVREHIDHCRTHANIITGETTLVERILVGTAGVVERRAVGVAGETARDVGSCELRLRYGRVDLLEMYSEADVERFGNATSPRAVGAVEEIPGTKVRAPRPHHRRTNHQVCGQAVNIVRPRTIDRHVRRRLAAWTRMSS